MTTVLSSGAYAQASTYLIAAATVILASPGPMDWATSATETGPGNSRRELSGSVIWIM